jgi:hypothetical protein
MSEIKYEIIQKIGVLSSPLLLPSTRTFGGHLPLRSASGTMSPKSKPDLGEARL